MSHTAYRPRLKPAPPDGEHYRELARNLIELAAVCRLIGARSELSELAASFARRADLLDRRCR